MPPLISPTSLPLFPLHLSTHFHLLFLTSSPIICPHCPSLTSPTTHPHIFPHVHYSPFPHHPSLSLLSLPSFHLTSPSLIFPDSPLSLPTYPLTSHTSSTTPPLIFSHHHYFTFSYFPSLPRLSFHSFPLTYPFLIFPYSPPRISPHFPYFTFPHFPLLSFQLFHC